jgi:DNA-binding PadR family transcriptional regulator
MAEPTLPTLGYALLSMLARGPLTGYEMSQRLREPIGLFWDARHSQIYPLLAQLEERGMVTAVSGIGPGPRPKKTYRITRVGLSALRAWIPLPARRWGGRDELLLKVYASWVARPSATLKLVQDAEAHHAGQLATYESRLRNARARGMQRSHPQEPAFTDYATLRRGVSYERGRLAWCRWLIRRLEQEPDSPRP